MLGSIAWEDGRVICMHLGVNDQADKVGLDRHANYGNYIDIKKKPFMATAHEGLQVICHSKFQCIGLSAVCSL